MPLYDPERVLRQRDRLLEAVEYHKFTVEDDPSSAAFADEALYDVFDAISRELWADGD